MEKHKIRRDDDEADRTAAVESADDTGMVSNEALITEAEIEHPEMFEHDKKKRE